MSDALHAARGRQDAHASSPEFFWRIANPIMTALIGLCIAGGSGALIGLLIGVCLVFAPDVIRLAPALTNRLWRLCAPHLATAGQRLLAYLPAPLITLLAKRRAR